MGSSADLASKAQRIRLFAGRIETAVDPSLKSARTSDWNCANGDDVRSQLSAYRSVARAAADQLRLEALSLDGQASVAARQEASRD